LRSPSWSSQDLPKCSWLTILLVGVLLCGCGNKGITRYDPPGSKASDSRTSPESVELYFATLDSIDVYIHVFPTGLANEAPNLDPRTFCSPDVLIEKCQDAKRVGMNPEPRFGPPSARYRVVGEVEVPLTRRGRTRSGQGSRSSATAQDDLPIAPNGKPFAEPNALWELAFKQLRENAAELGADALIEVFCGKGVSSFWYPPASHSVPMYGPNGQIVGSYSQSTPGGVGLSGWKLHALAVTWQTD